MIMATEELVFVSDFLSPYEYKLCFVLTLIVVFCISN